MKSIVITGCDSRYFPSARGLVRSLRRFPELSGVRLGCLDLGLDAAERRWLAEQNVDVQTAAWDIDFPARDAWEAARPWFKAYLCRPHLRRYFPDYETYLWLDADTWVQQASAVEQLLAAARQGGLAACPQVDRGYANFWKSQNDWQQEYNLMVYCLGPELAQKLAFVPTINAGVLAMHRNAPQWDTWRHYLELGLNRVDPNQEVSRMVAQVALNAAVHIDGFGFEAFPCTHNWLVRYAWPSWEVTRNQFVEPAPPHGAIGIIHRGGLRPDERKPIKLLHQGAPQFVVDSSLTFESQQELTAAQPQYLAAIEPYIAEIRAASERAHEETDYVSPGLAPVAPDACFPHLVVGDKSHCLWNYLRREVPHRWYVDRRVPGIGFLNRDEAHVLYNVALRFRGRRALEVGCWMGWSTCHLALAGVVLDVVDPALADPRIRGSVASSLQAAHVLERVNLVSGASPQAVRELAEREQRRWSLFFIDGDHEADAPRNDTAACEPYAEADAAFVFHDLVSPHVAAGLRYLKDRGWQTRVFHTMQVMGMAWRGDVAPIEHVPDPNVRWSVPEHLRDFPSALTGAGG